MTAPRLLLIDGHNVVRRVYEAIKDAPDESERVKRAMRSSLQSIRNALDETPTSHALAVFDHGGETWRHRLYPQYKANRPAVAQEFKDAIAGLRERIEGTLGVHTVAVPQVEADDVIAAVFRRWVESGQAPDLVTVLSTDKDLAWLLSHGAQLRHHFEHKAITAEMIEARFGVKPALLLDLLALMGDKSDGVPGLDGCGPKSAAKWLNQYGSLAGVLENAAEIGGKIGEKLRDGIEVVKLSRKLVSFHTKVQCGVTWGQLRRQ